MCCKQIPHVNVMSKLDLLNKQAKTKLERYLEPDMLSVLEDEMSGDEQLVTRFQKLNHALATLVRFHS